MNGIRFRISAYAMYIIACKEPNASGTPGGYSSGRDGGCVTAVQ